MTKQEELNDIKELTDELRGRVGALDLVLTYLTSNKHISANNVENAIDIAGAVSDETKMIQKQLQNIYKELDLYTPQNDLEKQIVDIIEDANIFYGQNLYDQYDPELIAMLSKEYAKNGKLFSHELKHDLIYDVKGFKDNGWIN